MHPVCDLANARRGIVKIGPERLSTLDTFQCPARAAPVLNLLRGRGGSPVGAPERSGMDSFEVNKVAGAVLGTLLLAIGSGFVAELIYHGKPAGTAGYVLPEPVEEAPVAGGEAPKAAEPIAVRLASADPMKGQAGSKACQACHSFDKASANKVGPGLWEVVERKKGAHEGFEYSAGMKEKGGSWSYEELDHFIENPKAYVKGTKMAFAGLASPTDRANVIAYLHTLSDSPKPLPVAEKTEAKPAEGKPAEAPKDAPPPEKP